MSPAPIPENEQDDPDKNQDGHLDVDSMETPQFNIAAGSSSDSEDDDPSNHGYELLPQDLEIGGGDDGANGSDEDNMTTNRVAEQAVAGSMEVECSGGGLGAGYQVPPLPHTEVNERRDLWTLPRPPSDKQPMDQEQADKIKAVMAGIKMPTSQQPSWARFVPEDQWKTQLLGKLHTDPFTASSAEKTKTQSKTTKTDSHKQEESSSKNSMDTATSSEAKR